MRSRALLFVPACLCFFSLFIACSKDSLSSSSDDGSGGDTGGTGGDVSGAVYYKVTAAEALAKNNANHEASGDYTYNASNVTTISLYDNSKTVSGTGASIDGSVVTIASAGTYSINGTLSDGRIIVDSKDEGIVQVILDDIDMTCSNGAPLFIKNAAKAVIILASGSNNTFTDGSSYVFDDTEEEEPNAAVFSKENLTIYGGGSLTVNGNFNDGISSKDGLIIKSGTITVTAVDDGIRGKDYLVIQDGDITVNAGGDGLKSDDDEDAANGYVCIEDGDVSITAGGDAIDAATDVVIEDGTIDITAGGGSSSRVNESISTKGIKGTVSAVIDGGTVTVNSSDDAVHSNSAISINGGTLELSTNDDGVHADTTVGINGGEITIAKSYEGIESRSLIAISGGEIRLVSSDDGINIAAGDGGGGGFPGRTNTTASGSRFLYINGGSIVVTAAGDGIDINGSVLMTGGDLIISGPTSTGNGALDYDSAFKITSGFLAAAGSSGMAMAPGTSSTQYSVLINFSSMLSAGTIVNIQTASGTDVLTFAPSKSYSSLAFSSSQLVKGTTYNVYYGGSSTGALTNGIYEGGTYTAGTKYTSFTVSSVVTTVNR